MKSLLAVSSIFVFAACSEGGAPSVPTTPPAPPVENPVVPYNPVEVAPEVVMESVRNWCAENLESAESTLCVCAQDVTKMPADCDWDIDPYSIPNFQ